VTLQDHLKLRTPVLVNPGFPGFKAKIFDLVLAATQTRKMKHLKLPAIPHTPTDIDAKVPKAVHIVYVGRCDNKMLSIEQVCHSQSPLRNPGLTAIRPAKMSSAMGADRPLLVHGSTNVNLAL
jgi:hypothetical protein